ncbi:MAG TPA: hypothetical protein VHU80_16020 [Polyangiaceae bacterium]|jgi:hypothetical protein|nr:hypothetical protein [Polyangiaceae bacterium]
MKSMTEAKWRSRVAEWRASGLTAETFASGKGYEASTLRFWSSRLRHKEDVVRPAPEAVVAMAQVVRTPSVARDEALTIAIGRARVVVTRGFDAELLRTVVDALEGRS